MCTKMSYSSDSDYNLMFSNDFRIIDKKSQINFEYSSHFYRSFQNKISFMTFESQDGINRAFKYIRHVKIPLEKANDTRGKK